MGNGQPAALAAADVVVSSNADDGVAEAVSKYIGIPSRQSDRIDADGAVASGAAGGPAAAPLEFFTLDMCPYAQRCWIVLEELGVPCARLPISRRRNERRQSIPSLGFRVSPQCLLLPRPRQSPALAPVLTLPTVSPPPPG